MHAHSVRIARDADLTHRVTFSPAHLLRVLKKQTQGVQIVAERDVLHGVNLDTMGFVPLVLAGLDRDQGHVPEEIHQRSETYSDAFGRARLLPVLHILAPSHEFASGRREVPGSLSLAALLR